MKVKLLSRLLWFSEETVRLAMTSKSDLVIKVRYEEEMRRLPLAQDEQYETLAAKVSARTMACVAPSATRLKVNMSYDALVSGSIFTLFPCDR